MLDSAGGRARLIPYWNGADADRLLDERHAAMVERVVAVMTARGWRVEAEVSFSEYGERGSIDVLGLHETLRAVGVCETKSAIGSLEETNRVLDAKERLAPAIVWKRYGWRPSVVGRLLVVPRASTVRRVIDRHGATMRALYPGRSHDVRAWLRQPVSPLRAIWFVSDGPDRSEVIRETL